MSVATKKPAAFERGAQLLVELHELIEQGKGDDAEADEIRDQMEINWDHLDDVKRARLEGLSADLYTLGSDSPIVHPAGSRVLTQSASDFLKETELRRDWDGQLEFIRKHPDEVGADLAAYIRGYCWTNMELPDVGMLFLERAAEGELKFRPTMILPLLDLGRKIEAVELCEQMLARLNDFDSIRAFIIGSACSHIATQIAQGRAEQIEWIDKIISAYEYGLKTLPESELPFDYLDSPAARYMYESLGLCYLIKSDFDKTRWALSEALKRAPDDANLLSVIDWLDKQSQFPADPVVLRVLETSLHPSVSHFKSSFQSAFYIPIAT